MPSHRLDFPGASGDRLAALLDLPAGAPPVAWALFAHCFTCSKDLKAAVSIARELNRHRIAVLRFDFTGLGESEGDFAGTSFSANVADLVAAAGFMAREHTAPAILVGHSLGGAAVLHAASSIPSARAVATIGAPFDPAHVRTLLAGTEDLIRREGSALVRLGGRSVRIGREFLEDLETGRSEAAISTLGCALLVLHSPVDRIVGIENAARIYQAARHPRSFIALDGADHLLSDEDDARYAAAVLAVWAGRYVESPPEETLDQLRTGYRVTARLGGEGLATEVMAGGHALTADEPVAVGGSDQGPSPYELVAAALGACTAMTLRLYAGRKGWDLREVEVGLHHSRLHAEDERECEHRPARMDRLDRRIRLEGTLTQDQRRRLLEIADRCPVYRTLEAGIQVVTEEVAPPG